MDNEIKTYIFRIASELDCSTASLAYNPMERFADYVSTKEIVHSKIIADLLNPNGEHQLGNLRTKCTKYDFYQKCPSVNDINRVIISRSLKSGQTSPDENL